MSDAALLALIVDDNSAIKILAAWSAIAPTLASALEPATLAEIAEISGVYERSVPGIVKRLLAAHVLVDGGITELADKLLQTHVQQRLGGGRKRR